MIATVNKPSMPSNYEIAVELGIKPSSPGWKKEVAKARERSSLQKAWGNACAEVEKAHPEIYAAITAERKRFEDAGMSHLYGGRFVKSQRGTIGIEISGNRAASLTRKECEFIGRTPGPGND